VLWYPTQAKTGLEWGTQPSLPVKQADHSSDRMDRKKPQVPPLRFAPVGMTNWFECRDAGTQTELSSRPERTRISYIAAPPKATYAAFRKESRMKFANANKLNRKSGGSVVQGPAVGDLCH
jgi:hypothetical protein